MKKRILFFVTVIPIYAALFGELYLRVFDPVPILPRYVKAMPFGVRGNTENMTYWHHTAEYKVEIQTNSKGIRADREFPYEKPDGVKRIVLLGDSFGMGYGVDFSETFSQMAVQFIEKKTGERVEMINLSTSGHGNAEELIVLQEEGFRYDPDLVLISWHASDLNDNVRSGLFALENGELIQVASVYLPAVKAREYLFSIAAYRFLIGHSHFYNFAREEAARFVKTALLVFTSSSEGTVSIDEDAVLRAKENLSLALLERINRECRKRDVNFMVLEIPVRSSRTKFVSLFPRRERQYPYVKYSPLSSFLEYEGGGKLYWERSHGHFTPLGCSITGAGVAETIVSNKLLEVGR